MQRCPPLSRSIIWYSFTVRGGSRGEMLLQGERSPNTLGVSRWVLGTERVCWGRRVLGTEGCAGDGRCWVRRGCAKDGGCGGRRV